MKNLFKVDEIKVSGNRKIEAAAILEKIGVRAGMEIDNYSLRTDVKRIYEMKYFENVEMRRETKDGKNLLIINVDERPIVSKITLEGNDEVDSDDLKKQYKVKEYSILDINAIKADIEAMQKFYEEKGFYLAGITHEIRPVDKENIELVYKINENEQVLVKKITFLGNNVFSDQALKDVMETRESKLLSVLDGSGNFKDFGFQTDIERLKYFYRSRGYLQINIGTPEVTVSEDRRWIFITMKVQEGPKFSVNKISFNGDLLFTEDELLKDLQMKEEDIYSEEKIRQDIQTLTEKYQDEGYAFANVLRNLEVVPGENKVDIEYSFEKGKITYFGKFTVLGNSKTRDKVVRRELEIFEGERFSGSKLRRSKENVNRLGFFEQGSVIFNTVSPKGKDDVLDLEVSVKERNTGQISAGAGYSSQSGGFFQASIAQNNFRGLGQVLNFQSSFAQKSTYFNLGFTDPYFYDTKWTFGWDIFSTKDKQSTSYQDEKQGFNLRIGHPVFDYTMLFLTYKFADSKISLANNPLLDLNIENGISSGVEGTIQMDRRNNKFEPTGGTFLSGSLEYTGVGGDQRFLTSRFDARFYYRVIGDLVFRSRAVTERVYRNQKEIPYSAKLALGGTKTLRGYNYEAIGPKVKLTDPADGLQKEYNKRGLHSVFGTIELEHPLIPEAGMKIVTFADLGNVYESHIGENGNFSMSADYGFGIRWFSPIGIIRLEMAYPMNKKITSDSNQFIFDIGQLF